MTHLGFGLHRHKKLHRKSGSDILDKIVYVIVFSGMLLTLPQIVNVWVDRNISGISLVSWSAYLVVSIFWFIYGLHHREKLIITTSFFWIILHGMVVVGILLH
jgi:hypothetical protein